MQCVSPISIARPGGQGAKDRVTVPCGRCYACLINRREDWTIRLLEEFKVHDYSYFITLTYAEENLTLGSQGNGTLVKADIQKFWKRLRNQVEGKVRYYVVGEYGTHTKRPHYHAIVFAYFPLSSVVVDKAWSLGGVLVTLLNGRRIAYTCKYHVNRGDYPSGCLPPFSLMSRRPGIGQSYVDRMDSWHHGDIDRSYYQLYEFKKKLPRYFKNRLYSADQRKKIGEVFQDRDLYSVDRIREYQRTHPGSSYFKYVLDSVAQRQSLFRDKSNLNDKL